MAAGADEATLISKALEYAWAFVGILVGIIWRRHERDMDTTDKRIVNLDTRIDDAEKNFVPMTVYEQNRKENRDVQIKIFDRLDQFGQALARIEGKLDK